MAEHTTGRWFYDPTAAVVVADHGPADPEYTTICELVAPATQADANGEYIARIANAHDALVAACNTFVATCEKMYQNPGRETLWFDAPYNAAKAALAAATPAPKETP